MIVFSAVTIDLIIKSHLSSKNLPGLKNEVQSPKWGSTNNIVLSNIVVTGVQHEVSLEVTQVRVKNFILLHAELRS